MLNFSATIRIGWHIWIIARMLAHIFPKKCFRITECKSNTKAQRTASLFLLRTNLKLSYHFQKSNQHFIFRFFQYIEHCLIKCAYNENWLINCLMGIQNTCYELRPLEINKCFLDESTSTKCSHNWIFKKNNRQKA